MGMMREVCRRSADGEAAHFPDRIPHGMSLSLDSGRILRACGGFIIEETSLLAKINKSGRSWV